MDNRKQALTDMLAKVEAGDWFPGFGQQAFGGESYGYAYDAYKGSLDAAMALHKAVLPGWEWSLDRDGADVWINNPDKGPYPVDGSPARAWLMAIIKALIAKGTE